MKLDGILFFSDLWKPASFCCNFVIFTRHIWVEDYFIHSISGGKPYFWIQLLVQYMFSISFSKPIKIWSAVSGHLQPLYVPYFIALKIKALATLMPICGKWVKAFCRGPSSTIQFSLRCHAPIRSYWNCSCFLLDPYHGAFQGNAITSLLLSYKFARTDTLLKYLSTRKFILTWAVLRITTSLVPITLVKSKRGW